MLYTAVTTNWIKVTLIVHPYLLLQDTSYFYYYLEKLITSYSHVTIVYIGYIKLL